MDLLRRSRFMARWLLDITIFTIMTILAGFLTLIIMKQDTVTLDQQESQVDWTRDKLPLQLMYSADLEDFGPQIVDAVLDLNKKVGCDIVAVMSSEAPDLVLTSNPEILRSEKSRTWKVFVNGNQIGVASIDPPYSSLGAYRATLHALGHLVGLGDDRAWGSVMNPESGDEFDLTDEDVEALNRKFCH